MDLEHAVDAEGFVAEAVDGICILQVRLEKKGGGGDKEKVWMVAGKEKKKDKGKDGMITRTLNLLRRGPQKMIHLALVRRSTSMPEEQPLQALVPLQLVLEPKPILLIRKLEQIQQLGRSLHDGERRRLRVVDDDGDAAVGVQAQEPFFLLLVRADVDNGCGPLGVVGEGELFEQNLHFLPVGRRLRDQVETLVEEGGQNERS